MKHKISEMKQHVNSKKIFIAICLSSFNLLTCDPDSTKLYLQLIYLTLLFKISFSI